ncbi:MAG: ECF transporter S component [Clostridia bacterium]|nr:ECF transporter S component [Clostridia bacterium]
MPLGQGALGLGVSYALALGYLVLMWFFGSILTKQYPTEQKVAWDTRTIARVTILAAVSGAGAMIKIPGPATTIALDAAAGYFAAAFFGWPVGATVAAIGCFLANALGGFASWLPMVVVYISGMALTVTLAVFVAKKVNIVAAIVVGTIVNTLTCLGPWAIMVGPTLMIALLPSQIIGSAVNAIVGLTVAVALKGAQNRKRPESVD